MPETILDTDNAFLTFKEREWQLTRDALTLPGIDEDVLTEGSDWLSIIEYAINEYLEKQTEGLR